MSILRFIFGQYRNRFSHYLGLFILSYGQIGIFVQGTTFAASLGSFYILINQNYHIALFEYVAVIAFCCFAAILIGYKFLLPSTISASNRQGWKHDSPVRVEIKLLRAEVKELRKMLEVLIAKY
jgi:hypothetical protein